MNTADRNRRIYEIRRSHPSWTYQNIGELVGLTRQRVQQIVRHVDEHGESGIMEDMEPIKCSVNGDPMSATQVAKSTGIPYSVISSWVSRGLVKVVYHPGHAAPGKVVLLDPVSLKERIALYRPKRRRQRVAA